MMLSLKNWAVEAANAEGFCNGPGNKKLSQDRGRKAGGGILQTPEADSKN